MHPLRKELVKFIEENVRLLPSISTHSIYFRDRIPQKKLNNAKKVYAQNVFNDTIIAFHDNTLFGKGDDGFIITPNAIYFHELLGDPKVIPFEHIEKVELQNNNKKPILFVHFQSGKLELTKNVFDLEPTAKFLNEIQNIYREIKEQGIELDPDHELALEEMKKELQILYIKTLVAFDIEDNHLLESGPLSEILSLMTQLHFNPEMRHEVRSYISNLNQSLDELIERVCRQIPKGNERNFKMSLIKDMIRVRRSRVKTKAAYVINLVNIASKLDVNSDQIDLIEKLIINDEKLINGDISDSEFARSLKDLVAKGGALGVPIAAIYMSGSVVGLSAAGITSGLAALGFGGLLGFSSMVTGIGVLIIGGVIIYSGIKYIAGGSEREKKSKREKMIQEIVKHHQETINNLFEDINFFTEELNALLEDRETNALKLTKLQAEIQLFKEAMSKLRNREQTLANSVKS
jgi:hypothetical protein